MCDVLIIHEEKSADCLEFKIWLVIIGYSVSYNK